jgi:hypothetical protein
MKMDKAVKNIFYLILTGVVLVLFFSIRGCIGNANKADYLFRKWVQDSTKMQVIQNQLGQTSYIAQVTQLTQDQMKQYAKSDSIISALTERYSKLEAIVRSRGGVYVDTLWLFREDTDTLPCAEFEKTDTIKTRYYSFDYRLTKRSMSINNLTFPDTVHTIIGERKSGFLGMKKTLVVEQTHSNKYIQVQELSPVITERKKTWPTWLGIGAGAGIAAGYFLFR